MIYEKKEGIYVVEIGFCKNKLLFSRQKSLLLLNGAGTVSGALTGSVAVITEESSLVTTSSLGGLGVVVSAGGDVEEGAVSEDVVLVEHHVGPDLDDVLDKPPGDAVGPDEEGHELVLVGGLVAAGGGVPEAHGVDVVGGGRGPEGGDAGGDEEGADDAEEEDLGGGEGEEGLVAGAAGEEGQEVGDGDLEVDGGDDLVVVEAGEAHGAEPGVVGEVGIEFHPEEEEGGDAGDGGEDGSDEEEDGEVPLHGAEVGNDVVVTDGHEGTVVEEGDEHEHEDGEVEEFSVDTGDAVLGG